MPAADFRRLIPHPLRCGSTLAQRRISPGNAHPGRMGEQQPLAVTSPPSRLCPPHIRLHLPYRYRALTILAFSPDEAASYAIPVRRTSALPSPSFRFHLTMDTLGVRLTVPPVRACGRLSLPGGCALPGAPKKAPPPRGDGAFTLLDTSFLILRSHRPGGRLFLAPPRTTVRRPQPFLRTA